MRHRKYSYEQTIRADMTETSGGGDNAILHILRWLVIDLQQFDGEKSRYWQDRFKAFSKEEIKRIYH